MIGCDRYLMGAIKEKKASNVRTIAVDAYDFEQGMDKAGWLSYDLSRWAYLAVILRHDHGRDHLVLLLF